MGAQIDDILKQCPPWVRVGMIAIFWVAVPLFGIMLAKRFYSGPFYVTGILFALLLSVLTLLERVRAMGLPADLAQVTEMYAEARTRFLDGGAGAKRFVWNVMRTIIATIALGIVLGFEPRLSSALWWMILLTGGIAIGFSSVRAFIWSLLVVSVLAWAAAYFLIGVNFNSPEARETFLIGWTTGTIVLSWNWIIAAAFAGPLMIAMAVGGSQSLEQARYLRGLRREESEFDAMIEARRVRLRRARSQQANDADEIDVDEPLRRAESELRAQVNKSPAQNSNEPVRFPRPEDFLKRDGGEMLALEHRDPMRILGDYAEFYKRIEAAEAASGQRHDTTGRRGFDRQLLNMSAELKSVMFGSTLPEIVGLREYFESLVRLEQGVASVGIYAGVVPVPLGDLDGNSPSSTSPEADLAFIDQALAEASVGADDDDDFDLPGGLSSSKFGDLFGETSRSIGSADESEGEAEGGAQSYEDDAEPSVMAQRRLTATLAAEAADAMADEQGSEQGADDVPASSEKDKEVSNSDGSSKPDRIEMLERLRTIAEGRAGDTEDDLDGFEGAVPLGSTAEVDVYVDAEAGDAGQGAAVDADGEASAEGADDAVVASAEAQGEVDEDEAGDETADNADEGAAAEESDVTDVSMPNQGAVTAPVGEMDDAAIMRRLMGGRVVTSLVLKDDRRFCDESHMIALGASPLMAKRVAGRVSGWFEAYAVERDLLSALEDGADEAFVREMVGEMAGKGWIFSRQVGEIAGLQGPFRDDVPLSASEIRAQIQRGIAEFEAEEAKVASQDAQALVEGDTAESLPVAPAVAEVVDLQRPAEEDAIISAISPVAFEEAENDGSAAVAAAEGEPAAVEIDLRGLGIRILAGTYDDDLLDTAPNHFESVESFAVALGLPEASVANQYDQFLKVSRARAVHVAALAALQKGDVPGVEALLERRNEFDGYEHPDVSLDALETWVKGQKAVGSAMAGGAATPSGMLDRLDGNRRLFVLKRCGLYQHKDILSLVDNDLPKSLGVLSGLLQAVSLTGPDIDPSMALVVERALRSTRELVTMIMDAAAAAKITPQSYVDHLVGPLTPTSKVGGWELLEALRQEPPALDLGFDWSAIVSTAAPTPANDEEAPEVAGVAETEGEDQEIADEADQAIEEPTQLRKSALVIPVDARRTYEQVCALDVKAELEALDISKPVFPTVAELQRSARMTFRDLFAEKVDAMVRVENSSKQMALKIEIHDGQGRPLGHILCLYFPVNAPQPVWCEAVSEKIHFMKLVDGKRDTVDRELAAMRVSVKSALSSGVGDPDLCLAVVYMSPYVSQDGETSFQPITEEFNGRFRILRSGGDGKLSMGALREYVSGIRLLAANGGAENVFGKNASVQIPVLSVKE